MVKGKDFTGIAVVFACHDGKGNLLFAKRGEKVRDGSGLWEVPAGGVKYGERVEDALLRELKEELCVEPLEYRFIDYKDVIQREGESIIKHWLVVQYLVRVEREQIRIGEPESCSELRWCRVDEVPQPLHFGTDETIKSVAPFL